MGRPRRRGGHGEHENHERWLVSYADFITLLFAFFVVMYSISQVNEGKYRVLSEALMAAFQNTPRSMEPIQVGEVVRSPGVKPDQRMMQPTAIDAQTANPMPVPFPPQQTAEAVRGGNLDAAALERLKSQVAGMAASVEQALGDLVQQELVTIRRKPLWIEVEFNTNTLFRLGSVELPPESRAILQRLARVLQPFPARLHVEGFTDDLPISTAAYPSNWELSAARAASVVHLFSGEGIDPRRMAAIGYGEYRPVADNATDEGRARNRRVMVVVLPEEGGPRGNDAAPELLREELERMVAPAEAAPEPGPQVAAPTPEAAPAAEAAPPERPALSEETGWQ